MVANKEKGERWEGERGRGGREVHLTSLLTFVIRCGLICLLPLSHRVSPLQGKREREVTETSSDGAKVTAAPSA